MNLGTGLAILIAAVWVRHRFPAPGRAQYVAAFVTVTIATTLAILGTFLWDRRGHARHRAAGLVVGRLLLALASNVVQCGILGLVITAAWLYTRIESDHAAAVAQCAVDSARMDEQAAEARLQMLEAQIEPHFLFNTLAHVKRLYETEREAGARMLDNLMAYLAVALPQMRATESTLGRELDHARAYLEIQQIRMGRRLAFGFDVAEPLRAARLPPLMLLTLVENAIKHGLTPQLGGGRIDIRASVDDGRSSRRGRRHRTGVHQVRRRRHRPRQHPGAARHAVRREREPGARAQLAGRCRGDDLAALRRRSSRRSACDELGSDRHLGRRALRRAGAGRLARHRVAARSRRDAAGSRGHGLELVRRLPASSSFAIQTMPLSHVLEFLIGDQIRALCLMVAIVIADRAVDVGAPRRRTYVLAALVGCLAGFVASEPFHWVWRTYVQPNAWPRALVVDQRRDRERLLADRSLRRLAAGGQRLRVPLRPLALRAPDRAAAECRRARPDPPLAHGPRDAPAGDAGARRAAVPVQHPRAGRAPLPERCGAGRPHAGRPDRLPSRGDAGDARHVVDRRAGGRARARLPRHRADAARRPAARIDRRPARRPRRAHAADDAAAADRPYRRARARSRVRQEARSGSPRRSSAGGCG